MIVTIIGVMTGNNIIVIIDNMELTVAVTTTRYRFMGLRSSRATPWVLLRQCIKINTRNSNSKAHFSKFSPSNFVVFDDFRIA